MEEHERDQFEAAVRDITAMMAAHRDSLLANGFTRAEAFALVIDYQRILLMKPARGSTQD